MRLGAAPQIQLLNRLLSIQMGIPQLPEEQLAPTETNMPRKFREGAYNYVFVLVCYLPAEVGVGCVSVFVR